MIKIFNPMKAIFCTFELSNSKKQQTDLTQNHLAYKTTTKYIVSDKKKFELHFHEQSDLCVKLLNLAGDINPIQTGLV